MFVPNLPEEANIDMNAQARSIECDVIDHLDQDTYMCR